MPRRLQEKLPASCGRTQHSASLEAVVKDAAFEKSIELVALRLGQRNVADRPLALFPVP